MSRISAIIIAKNAEDLIQECLNSLSFCSEIIIVDNESTDATLAISKKAGVKVFSASSDDFSKLRNIGLQKAKENWVLYVDTDERVSPELKASIIKAVEHDQFSAYRVKRKNFYLGRHEWPYIEYLERLFKKENIIEWYGKLHETPRVKGEIGELDGFLYHYTHRNLTVMLEKTITWSGVEAQLRFAAGHPRMAWWRFPRVMITAFVDSYIRQGGWRAGTVGLIESIYQSFSMFITYARLWEMQERERG